MHSRFLPALALVFLSTQAGAVSVAGDISIVAPPADASSGALESNIHAFLWDEGITTIAQPLSQVVGKVDSNGNIITILPFQNITPEAAGSSNGLGEGSAFYDSGNAQIEGTWGGDLAAGTYQSYFFHADKNGPNVTFTGSMTFDYDIVGIVYKQTELCETDDVFGVPTTVYSECGSGRILELDGAANWLSLSADRKTLAFSSVVAHNMDDMRIITTTVPVPGAAVLFPSALAIFAFLRRRKSS